MKPIFLFEGGLGSWEILVILVFIIGMLSFIYYLGYKNGRRKERLKNLEERVKEQE